MQILSYVIAILILMLVVMIHEYGHFIAARKCNVFVKTFSIGFGKTLCSIKSKKSGTIYKISAIPLGGYIDPLTRESLQSMKNECIENGGDIEELNRLDGRTMEDAKPIQRFWICIAGPLANFISAAIIFVCLYCCVGIKEYRVVEETQINTQYRLQPNDIIIKYRRSRDCQDTLVLSRAGVGVQAISITNTDESVNNVDDFVRNVLNKDKETVQIKTIKNPIFLLKKVLMMECKYTQLTGQNLIKIFSFSKESHESVGGFGSIIAAISKQVCSGFAGAVDIIIWLSIALGAFNMMPIIPLDGGRMVVELYQVITRKNIHQSVEKYISKIGIGILLAILIYANMMDIIRFLFR